MPQSAHLRPEPRASVAAIDAYIPGKSSAPGVANVWKLSSNESPLGPSPNAVAAYAKASGKLEIYPDGNTMALRTAIAARYGLDPARIVCGNGSDELLALLAMAYVGPGDEGIYSRHGFLLYRSAILAAGGTPVVAPERDLTTDVDAILAAVTERTKIVYIANPNSPTGTYIPFDEVKRLHSGLRPDILLVLDGAYAEYVRRNDYSSGLDLVAHAENVVMTRTFSKIHGLAALRLGWLVAPAHVVETLHKLRLPFSVNGAAIAAGVASIDDGGFTDLAVAHNERWVSWLTDELTKLGLTVAPSAANFVLVSFPAEPGKTAAEADAFLLSKGLILRRVEAYGLPDSLRLTIGVEEANRLVVEALREFLSP